MNADAQLITVVEAAAGWRVPVAAIEGLIEAQVIESWAGDGGCFVSRSELTDFFGTSPLPLPGDAP